MIKTILSYYQNALLFDENLKLSVEDKSLLYGNKQIPDKFKYIGYGISNFFAEDFFVNFVKKSILDYDEKFKKKKDYSAIEDYPYEYFYCPFLVTKTEIEPKSQKEKTINYPIIMTPIPYRNVLDVINALQSNKSDTPLLKSTINIHPLSFSSPFGCVTSEVQVNFLKSLQEQSMDDKALNFEQLLYKLLVFVNEVTNIDLSYTKGENDSRTILERNKELIKALQEFYGNKQRFGEVIIHDEPWIITKTLKEENFTYGLMKVYDSVNKNGISKDSLLPSFFEGNMYKKVAVPFEKEEDNDSTIILNKEKLVDYLSEQRGALSKSFDLTYSQRFALAMYRKNLKVTAVNGPPGTGKTALLRAMVADTTVENAINVYKAFESGQKSFPFATPIVSFSTNNAALANITEGINDAFVEAIKSAKEEDAATAGFYERWLNLSFEYTKDNQKITSTINDALLYVPFIKNTQVHDFKKEKAPLYFFNIKNAFGLQKFIFDISHHYQNYCEMWIKKYLVFANDTRLTEELVLIQLNYFIEIAVKELMNKLNGNLFKLKEKKQQILNYIRNKKEYEFDLRALYELLKIEMPLRPVQNRNTLDLHIRNAEVQLNHLENNIKYLKDLYTKKEEERDIRLDSLNTKLMTEIAIFNKKADSQVEATYNENSLHLDTLKQRLTNKCSVCEKNISDIKEKIGSTIWGKIKLFLSESCDIAYFHDKRIKEYEDNITLFTTAFKLEEKSIKDKLSLVLKVIEKNRDANVECTRSQIKKDKEDLELLIVEEFKKLEDDFSSYCWGLTSKEASCISASATPILQKLKNENYFLIDDFEKEFMRIYEEVDISLRTENFFLATHILEGLLLIELKKSSELKSKSRQKCFACGNGLLQASVNNAGNEVYKCNKCSATFVNQNKYEPFRPLNSAEIDKLFTDGYVEIDTNIYTLAQNNSSDKSYYWNIRKGMGIVTADTQKLFRYMSVLFPIVNTTCHSFGTVFNINKDNDTVPEGFIDTLFMDESGMILVPFLVNLYAGKRVILFGDEKQIPPVYPFDEYKFLCNSTLVNIYAKNEEEKDKLYNAYSVISQNAMSLANVATYIKNPFIYNPLFGDLWLKEHFRCKTPIIEFCNKHIYNNYMTLCNHPEEDKEHLHLFACNHEFSSHKEEENGSTNREEGELILQYIHKKLKQLGGNTPANCSKIGIITPYAKQEKLFRELLKNQDLENILAGTVHKFQGSERETIFFSSTVGINDTKVCDAFYNRDNFNIINVAVSRAKNSFILFGNFKNIQSASSSYIGKLLEHIQEKGSSLQEKL